MGCSYIRQAGVVVTEEDAGTGGVAAVCNSENRTLLFLELSSPNSNNNINVQGLDRQKYHLYLTLCGYTLTYTCLLHVPICCTCVPVSYTCTDLSDVFAFPVGLVGLMSHGRSAGGALLNQP